MSEDDQPWRENVAAIVVDRAGRVLLGTGKGSKGYRHFPQGGVGRSETLEEALQRELWEEAGLAPERYRIVASFAGLRYRYRKGNEKRERWRGQQQAYFLLQCYGEMPPTDCSGTDEFERVEWLPWQELRPELFTPSKREAVAQALAHFFPPTLAGQDPVAYASDHLTTRALRYPRAPILFAGGKEEAALHLGLLSRRLCRLQKQLATCGSSLLILLHGVPGSGRRQAARRLAALMDPLRLRVGMNPTAPLLPAMGETVLLRHGGQHLPPFAGHTLPLFLQLDGAAAPADGSPWLIIPAERRWYRDLLIAEAVADALADCCVCPPCR